MKSNKTVDEFQSRLDRAKQRISKSEDRPEIDMEWSMEGTKRMENKDERIKDIEKNSKMNLLILSQNHRERCGTGAIFEEIMAENCPK